MIDILQLALSTFAAQAPQAAAPPTSILVVYHSSGGHTAALAAAVAEGARKTIGVGVTLKPVGQVTCAELAAADVLMQPRRGTRVETEARREIVVGSAPRDCTFGVSHWAHPAARRP